MQCRFLCFYFMGLFSNLFYVLVGLYLFCNYMMWATHFSLVYIIIPRLQKGIILFQLMQADSLASMCVCCGRLIILYVSLCFSFLFSRAQEIHSLFDLLLFIIRSDGMLLCMVLSHFILNTFQFVQLCACIVCVMLLFHQFSSLCSVLLILFVCVLLLYVEGHTIKPSLQYYIHLQNGTRVLCFI